LLSCKEKDQEPDVDVVKSEVPKADSVVTHGGNGRMVLTWLLPRDHSIDRYKVAWYSSSGTGSVTNKMPASNEDNLVRVVLEDLDEGNYLLNVYQYDENGTESPKSSTSGVVYGAAYEATLEGRTFEQSKMLDHGVQLIWESPRNDLFGTEIKYEGADGRSVVHFVPADKELDTLVGTGDSQFFEYRSLYLPESTAIDTFYTAYRTAQVGPGYSYKRKYDKASNTFYYLTHINHKDTAGNLIKLHHGFAGDPVGETGSEFAARMNCLLVFNGSTAHSTESPSGEVIQRRPTGIQIIDGEIVQELPRSYYTLGIKADNQLVSYPPGTTAAEMLADGANDVLSGFIPLIEDHSPVPDFVKSVYAGGSDKHPRQVIAQYDNLDILFLSCGGRGIDGEGMTADEVINILKEEGVKFAFMVDGGGSVTVVVEGERITKKIDYGGTTERPRPNFLYVQGHSNDQTR